MKRRARRPSARRSGVAPAADVRLPPGTVADVIGDCVLIFAFAPALTAIPGWLLSEAVNRDLLQDPFVLAFLLVRAVRAVLRAFYDGIVAGVLSGLIDGVLVCAWLRGRRRAPTGRGLYVTGAILGGVAACLMVVVVATVQALAAQPRVWGAPAVAFDVGAGLVCGTLAIATAARRLR
jgi:hypothetical protein